LPENHPVVGEAVVKGGRNPLECVPGYPENGLFDLWISIPKNMARLIAEEWDTDTAKRAISSWLGVPQSSVLMIECPYSHGAIELTMDKPYAQFKWTAGL
jgi:hypothetical protein